MATKLNDLFKKGASFSPLEALRLLTLAYMKMCGFSAGYRTVIFDSTCEWQNKLAWLDHPLAEYAHLPFGQLMPKVTEEYDCATYDKYDIIPLSIDETKATVKQMISDGAFDEDTMAVIWYGYKCSRKYDDIFTWAWRDNKKNKLVKTEYEGVKLKGYCYCQMCGETGIHMVKPFQITGYREKLVKDPKDLLKDIYNECVHIQNMEQEILDYYEQYKKELALCKTKSDRYQLFERVFEPIIPKDLKIVDLKEFISKNFGLQFHDL